MVLFHIKMVKKKRIKQGDCTIEIDVKEKDDGMKAKIKFIGKCDALKKSVVKELQ